MRVATASPWEVVTQHNVEVATAAPKVWHDRATAPKWRTAKNRPCNSGSKTQNEVLQHQIQQEDKRPKSS